MGKFLMYGFIIFFGACFGMSVCEYISSRDDKVAEWAYAQGQIEYSQGDIRVSNCGGKWIWIKSPWNNGDKPKIDPNDSLKLLFSIFVNKP
jgi:hypothetical protein